MIGKAARKSMNTLVLLSMAEQTKTLARPIQVFLGARPCPKKSKKHGNAFRSYRTTPRCPLPGQISLEGDFAHMFNERLNTVKRLRWVMRQKSRISKLLGISNAASMHCPYCKTKVHVGDFFCCPDLEQAWHMTEKSSSAPVLAENHF
jgi:hypothetical protein